MSRQFIIDAPEAMFDLAKEFVREIQGGATLLLSGELGAGKTTFSQGVARALGITQAVTSPSFTIVNEYRVPPPQTITTFVHADLYRLDEQDSLLDAVVAELLARRHKSGRLTLIEWSERLGRQQPEDAQVLRFMHGDQPTQRLVELS